MMNFHLSPNSALQTLVPYVPHPPLNDKLHDCSVNKPGFGGRAPGEPYPVVSENELFNRA